MEEIKNTIEGQLNKAVDLQKATDGVNLLYTAKIEGLTVANVYKSFDEKLNPIKIIRYTNPE